MRRSKGNYCMYTWEHFISCCNWANIITGKKYPTFLLIPRPADNHLKRVILESSFSDWFLLRRWKQLGVMMFYLKGRQYFVHKSKLPQGPGKLHLWPFFFFCGWIKQRMQEVLSKRRCFVSQLSLAGGRGETWAAALHQKTVLFRETRFL